MKSVENTGILPRESVQIKAYGERMMSQWNNVYTWMLTNHWQSDWQTKRLSHQSKTQQSICKLSPSWRVQTVHNTTNSAAVISTAQLVAMTRESRKWELSKSGVIRVELSFHFLFVSIMQNAQKITHKLYSSQTVWNNFLRFLSYNLLIVNVTKWLNCTISTMAEPH